MRMLRSAFVAAGLTLAAMAAAVAAEPSGSVVAAIQMAEATGPGGSIVLKPEAPIYSGDKIVTGPIGEAQIRFRDNTRLVVGPNSQLVIDAFVFSGDTARSVSINAVRGAFRFISGNSPSDTYKITTPTATIGVRGTEFDVDVDAIGNTRVVNFKGRTRICDRFPDDASTPIDPRDKNRYRGCVETYDPCGVSVVERGKDIRRFTDRNDRNRELNWYFRYVRDQSGLLPDFQVSLAECGDRTPEQIEFSPLPEDPPAPPTPPEPPCKHKCGGDKPDRPHHDGPKDKDKDKHDRRDDDKHEKYEKHEKHEKREDGPRRKYDSDAT